jgi:hypothetical protein
MNIAMLHSRFFCLFLMIILGTGYAFSQKSAVKLKAKADFAYSNANFAEALDYYRNSTDKNPDIIYNRALCYFNLNRFDSSLTDFEKYLSIKNHKDEAIFYTARALHHLEDFQKAVELYRLYLKVSKPKAPLRAAAKLLLLQASNANKTIRSSDFALLLPLGKASNSEADDFAPIENPRNPGQLYFSSNRRGRFELFFEKFSNQENNSAILLDARYNSLPNQQLVAFSDDGYQILYLAEGKIKMDNFKDGFEQSLAVPLRGLENIKIVDVHLVNDSILLFSADLIGGYGALDIYAAFKNEQGRWSKIINMGPKVNTVFSERAAFLADKSSDLFFSSNRPESMGGFDIFRLDIQNNNSSLPFSSPINSAGDDIFFRPEAEKKEVWFSSVRQNGFAALDNYRLLFREPIFIANDFNLHDFLFIERAPAVNQNDVLSEKQDTFYYTDINFDKEGSIELVADKILNETANLMLKHPELKIIISAHSDDLQPKEISLLFTLSQCEKAASTLQRKGISVDRIYLRGMAGQYPAAKNKKFDLSTDQTGIMINRRIALNFMNINSSKTQIIKKEKMISTVLKENAAEKYLEQISGLTFKVELSGSENDKNLEFLKSMNDVSLEKKALSPKVSFCLGLAKKFDAIAILLETVKASGFDNALIQAFWDGFPMDGALLEKMSAQEPELQKYKEYLKNKSGK